MILDDTIIQTIVAVVLTSLVALIAYVYKALTNRLDAVEQRVDNTMSASETRDMIKDHVEPISDRIQHIETKLDQIIQLLLSK